MLGNDEALQMYGDVMNDDLSQTLQNLLVKYIKGALLQMYSNEVRGYEAFEWKTYPQAFLAMDDKLECDMIEGRLTEIKGLLDFVIKGNNLSQV